MAHDERDAVLDCEAGSEYDEAAFSYFLGVERARADRGHYALRLLFASLEPADGVPVEIPPAAAARLFEGLRESLRDTDVTGWYRQGRVAGAVLTAGHEERGAEVLDVIEQRVGDCLRRRLSPSLAPQLKLRVLELEPRPRRLPSRALRAVKARDVQAGQRVGSA